MPGLHMLNEIHVQPGPTHNASTLEVPAPESPAHGSCDLDSPLPTWRAPPLASSSPLCDELSSEQATRAGRRRTGLRCSWRTE
jgi:hypothetical protein